jgi:hypothetical protein
MTPVPSYRLEGYGEGGAVTEEVLATYVGTSPWAPSSLLRARSGGSRFATPRNCSWGPRNIYYCKSLWNIYFPGPDNIFLGRPNIAGAGGRTSGTW